MSFLKTECGHLTVRFYGQASPPPYAQKVSVKYRSTDFSSNKIADDFLNYVGKIRFNLGDTEITDRFLLVLFPHIVNDIKKGSNIKDGGENYKLELVDETDSYNKQYLVTFYKGSKGCKLNCSLGGENYYAPMSVFAFLSFIVDTFSSTQVEEVGKSIKRKMDLGD